MRKDISTITLATVTVLFQLLPSVSKAAAGRNPEYVWQAASGEIALAAKYTQVMDYELKSESNQFALQSSTKESATGISGYLTYGFTDNLALAVGSFSLDSKSINAVSATETKRSGLGDVQARIATSWGNSFRLHLGVQANVSPGNRKDSFGGVDGNQYSGGNSYAPYVGLSIPVAGSSWVGIIGTFETKQDRKVEVSPASISTVTGGNVAQMTAFWEIPYRSILLDLAGGVRTVDKERTTPASGGYLETANYSATVAEADLKYMFAPTTLIGAQYLMVMNPDYLTANGAATIKGVNVSSASLLLRFGF